MDHDSRRICSASATNITSEWGHFHPPMNSGFFKSFESGCLSVGEPRLRAALGKNPAASASLHQKELNRPVAQAIADGCNLLRSAQAAKPGQRDELRNRPWF
jgi:hypothetical protein